jgi:simple sugar transport system substrate-binding protein
VKGEISQKAAVTLIIVIVVAIVGGAVGYALKPAEVAPGTTVTTTAPGGVTTVTTTAPGGVTTITTTAPAGPPKYTFYFVSHGGPGDPWWQPVIKGSQDASELLNVHTIYEGPAVFSIGELASMMESAIAARPDGIICTITDVTAMDPLVRDAVSKGIPVIAVNVNDPREPPARMPYLGYVGQQEHDAGAGMAKRVLLEFTPTRAVIGIHEVGHVGLEARAQGIIDTFTAAGLAAPDKLDITTDPAVGKEALRSYIIAHPDTDMIFLLGPIGAHPAIDLVKELGKVGVIRLATVDLDEKILAAIKDGTMICAVSQQPYMQGFLTVVWLYLHCEYGFIPPEQLKTGPGIVDSATVGFIEKQIAETGGA